MCASFVVSVRCIESWYRPLCRPGLFLWKKSLKHSKECFVSGCLKQDKVPGKFNGVYHTLDLEKAFSFSPWSPPEAFCGPQTPTFRLFHFPPFPSLTSAYRGGGLTCSLKQRIHLVFPNSSLALATFIVQQASIATHHTQYFSVNHFSGRLQQQRRASGRRNGARR